MPWARPLEVFGTMQTVLIIIHLIIVLALIGVVLLQRSEGGLGLGGGGGGGVSGFMTGRGQANALDPRDGGPRRALLPDEPRPDAAWQVMAARRGRSSRACAPTAPGRPAGSGRAGRPEPSRAAAADAGRTAGGARRAPAAPAPAAASTSRHRRCPSPSKTTRAGCSGPLLLWTKPEGCRFAFANRRPCFMEQGP